MDGACALKKTKKNYSARKVPGELCAGGHGATRRDMEEYAHADFAASAAASAAGVARCKTGSRVGCLLLSAHIYIVRTHTSMQFGRRGDRAPISENAGSLRVVAAVCWPNLRVCNGCNTSRNVRVLTSAIPLALVVRAGITRKDAPTVFIAARIAAAPNLKQWESNAHHSRCLGHPCTHANFKRPFHAAGITAQCPAPRQSAARSYQRSYQLRDYQPRR